MISIKPTTNIKIASNNNYHSNNLSDKNVDNSDRNVSPYKNRAICSYGKALVNFGQAQKSYDDKLDEIDLIANDEIISVEDAAKLMSEVSIAKDKKVEYILKCCFETNTPETVINKKALLLVKANLEHKKMFPKVMDAIKTCMDDETRSFDYDTYNSMLDYKGRVRISAKLYNDLHDEDSVIRKKFLTERRIKVMYAFGHMEPEQTKKRKVEVTYADIFTPLSKSKSEFLTRINKLEKDKEISKELKEKLKESIDNNNFNLREVYKKHYEPLKEINTLKEVKEKYPEIVFPKKPEYDPSKFNFCLMNRLSNEDFDDISLDIIRQGYVYFKPKKQIYVMLENSKPTTLNSLQGAGLNYSVPSDSIKDLLNDTDTFLAKLDSIQEIEPNKLKEMSRKNATKNSKVWAGFINATKGDWLPVRLIGAKRRSPYNSKYATPRLVDTYLYNLYKIDPNKKFDTKNPLEKFDNCDKLTKPMFNTVNNIYMTRYNEENDEIPYDRNFEKFYSKFDKDSIEKSIEHMEKKYTDHFYFKYFTAKRRAVLKDEIQKSHEIALEKYNFSSNKLDNNITDGDLNITIQEDFNENINQ